MRPLESCLSANAFLHVPSSSSSLSSVRKLRRTLVFFVPGNPGLIGYYHPFLALVARGLRGGVERGRGRERGHADEHGPGEGAVNEEDEYDGSGERCAQAVVAGFSLGGFEVDEEETAPQRGQKNSQVREATENEKDKRDEDDDNDNNGIPAAGPRRSTTEDRELLYPPTFPCPSHRAQQQQQQEKDKKKANSEEANGTAAEEQQQQHTIYTLREQIELSYARVEYLVQRLSAANITISSEPPEPVVVHVVLVGHSVGAYIALELVRLWHERHHHHHHHHQLAAPSSHTAADSAGRDGDSSETRTPSSSSRPSPSPSWSVSTCILLTPTIQDIHLSPSGRLATPALSYLSFLPGLAHMLLHTVLLRVLPPAWFSALVARLTGMHPGSHGFEATMAFLKSRRGVKQALFMARAEMQEIRSDAWGREVWGASHGDGTTGVEGERGTSTRSSSPRLFFWFAKKDHWIADVTKEAIFRSKAGDIGVLRDSLARPRPNLESEETKEVVTVEDQTSGRATTTTRAAKIHILETEAMVHAWCLNQSEFVARRVSRWLRDVLDEDNSLQDTTVCAL
ncbi:hypothetical protein AYL99_03287 [Fonsecaea erecta]|uniref:Uncharacterized protein n=1 Tax=Fonsecaea erecta TaxID=1367422 RepID=A0A178ZNX8_9EURO|nr:hypothetical protein AYL99_03287 [Fonsecaea erecta]OAP61086.1 hypothetical protein AYL99_03287 [Fonsecaea erecta]